MRARNSSNQESNYRSLTFEAAPGSVDNEESMTATEAFP